MILIRENRKFVVRGFFNLEFPKPARHFSTNPVFFVPTLFFTSPIQRNAHFKSQILLFKHNRESQTQTQNFKPKSRISNLNPESQTLKFKIPNPPFQTQPRISLIL